MRLHRLEERRGGRGHDRLRGRLPPSVSFASAIQVPSGRTADIEANGHTVNFDGGNKVRLFQVTGGKLTIGGISLNNAAVTTASGHERRHRR